MEVEQCSSVVAKKMFNTISIVFYMLKKGLSKNKPSFDLHHHHYATTTICRSTDVAMSLVSTRKEYEFSCSNTPLVRRRRKNHYNQYGQYQYRYKYTPVVSRKVYDDHDHDMFYESVEASPAVSLPGFGRSPATVRQLRVTDSPYSMKDVEENTDQLDKAAEEFIRKFYKELEKQKKMAPPQNYYTRAQ